MATQVVRTILERAARYGRFSLTQMKEVEEVERRAQAELSLVLNKVGHARWLALLDMDGVLVDGRFVVALAQRTNRAVELAEWLDRADVAPEERGRRIARLFKGVPRAEFEETARGLPLMEGADCASAATPSASSPTATASPPRSCAAASARRVAEGSLLRLLDALPE